MPAFTLRVRPLWKRVLRLPLIFVRFYWLHRNARTAWLSATGTLADPRCREEEQHQ